MKSIRQAIAVAGYNFRQWGRNPRIWLSFALGFILCFLLSNKVAAFAQAQGTALQLLEPFIWTFGDSTSILLSSVLLVFLFADIPFLSSGTPFYLVRTTRRTWLAGQLLYIGAATGLYLLFLLLSTVVLCAQNSFGANLWSPTAVILSYTGSDVIVPASLRSMQMSSPWVCAGRIFLLMLLYALMLVSVMLVFTLWKGQIAGVTSAAGFSAYGIFLSPDTLVKLLKMTENQRYLANTIIGWISPLSHATYPRHSFGYDLLPTLGQTVLVFTALLVTLVFLAVRIMSRYSFTFTGTEML